MRFEWDPNKAAQNKNFTMSVSNKQSSYSHPRLQYWKSTTLSIANLKIVGPIDRGLVLVVWTERSEDTIRLISAWWATKGEEELYREFLEDDYKS